MEPIVETHDLARRYRRGATEVRAVDGVSLTILPGEFMAVMGRSGSGKTTLLDLLGCLLRPSAGELCIEGRSVIGASDSDLATIRRTRIGFVFQEFNLIIIGASVIAVIVGGLSVINTMVMTVSERVREIGIKKAVGARTSAILREFMVEATLLGAIGGVLGLGAGALLVTVLNLQTAGSGTSVFLLTPGLLLRSFAFATALGALAGIYPAFRAARLDPVQALRSS